MKPINITNIIKKYGPGYIAKSRKTGRVIAHAKKLDLLFKKTGKRTDVTISWVPKSNVKYVFRITLPLLLGRKDIFEEKYNLLLDSKRKLTVISVNRH